MRLVIENGKQYTKQNFIMMLKELDPNLVDDNEGRFLRIIAEEVGVGLNDIENFLTDLKGNFTSPMVLAK